MSRLDLDICPGPLLRSWTYKSLAQALGAFHVHRWQLDATHSVALSLTRLFVTSHLFGTTQVQLILA